MSPYRILALAIAASIFAVSLARAQGTPPENEVVRGEAGRRMDRYLEAAQRFGFSGAVLVADRDGIVLRKGYGPADAKRRVAPEMLFDMGSMTKQFTAAGILLLESEGRLATTDSLAKFFPNAPADKRAITLHQLLTHTSGILSDFADDYAQVSQDSALRAIFNTPLQVAPGSEFRYSNAGFSLLAMLIEQRSGQSYNRFMEEWIFRPAGMRHTGYLIANLDSSLVAHSYTPPVDHGSPAERLHRAGGPGWNLKGNGGLLTSVDDLYRYERALRTGQPISQQIQAKQFAEQFRRSPTLAHGYDWWIEAAGDDGIQYNRAGDGPSTGVSAEYRKYPRDSTVFILLANNRHHGASTRRYVMPNLRRLYLGTLALEPPIVRGAAAAELDAVSGTYQVDSTAYFTLVRAGDHLALSAIGQPAVNVMVFNRDSNSIRGRERLNERATNLVRALAAADTSVLRSALGPQANLERILDWWRDLATRLGGFQGLRVLGSGRLDRGVFMSTVRVCFRDGSKTFRWAWAGSTPVLSSEDGYLPGVFAFGAESPIEAAEWSPYWWMRGKDSLVTYDMAFNSVLDATMVRRADGTPSELVFKLPIGEVRARRLSGSVRPAPLCSP